MKVLITGGCGFLGSNLASSFLAIGAEVTVIDALYRKGSSQNLHWLEKQSNNHQFHFAQLDVADYESVKSVFLRFGPFDYVCHVAGQVAMTTSLEDPRRDLQTNVLGTFNILEAVRFFSPESLVAYSSTNKVYGDLEWIKTEETVTRYLLPDYPNGLSETLPLDFSTPYGCSKGAADQYVRDWSRVYGLKTVVFRHSSIYGGRQFASIDQGWIGWFCQQAIKQKKADIDKITRNPFTISGTGKQVRDVLHAEDIIDLYQKAYQNKDNLNGLVFNIGGGHKNALSLIELFDLLAELLSIDSLTYLSIPRRSSDQDSFIADTSKAAEILGWKPKRNAASGIQMMIEWTNDNLNT